MQKASYGVLLMALLAANGAMADDTVTLGFNYPRTGPYFIEGLDELRAAEMAIEEINAAGGILGKKVQLEARDSKSLPNVTKVNVNELLDKHKVPMVFGGSASSVAVAASEVCQERGSCVFFGTLTYSNATTDKAGHRMTFRECYNAWMGAKVLGRYLKKNFPNKKYYYITADYTWGWTTEESMRQFTGTTDKAVHKGVLTPFPTAKGGDFKAALRAAQAEKPDVLVLVLFGKDMGDAINIAVGMGMKKKMQFVVPNLTLGMAEGSGPVNMEGVLGALPWNWKIPYKFGYARGQQFVEKYASRYKRYPGTAGASAYTIVYEYKAAVERAGSFEPAKVVKALEGHRYTLLKDQQYWRDFDHQSIQTVYAVKCNAAKTVKADKYRQDYFEIIDVMPGEEAAKTRAEWDQTRKENGKPTMLEKLPGEP